MINPELVEKKVEAIHSFAAQLPGILHPWISVKEGMPDKPGRFLVVCGSNRVVMEACLQYNVNRLEWRSVNETRELFPTHWMRLPDPPQQSSFDAWWETQTPFENDPVLRWIPQASCKMFRGHAKVIWDAAVKAAQRADYVP